MPFYEWETPANASAVPHLLGSFIISFSQVELLMIVAAAELAQMEVDALLFACKRLTADAKREILHRAVLKALVGERLDAAKTTLNRIQDLIRRRNDLLHGTYMYVHGEAKVDMHVGRLGAFGEPMEDTITDTHLEADLAELRSVTSDLMFLSARNIANEPDSQAARND